MKRKSRSIILLTPWCREVLGLGLQCSSTSLKPHIKTLDFEGNASFMEAPDGQLFKGFVQCDEFECHNPLDVPGSSVIFLAPSQISPLSCIRGSMGVE